MVKIDILLPGVPVKASRGFLGWCNVVLLTSYFGKLLFDTGSFADRKLLLESFQRRNIEPGDIDYLVLSHLHYDHCLNYDLFHNAEIIVGKKELEYAFSPLPLKSGDVFLPQVVLKELANQPVREVREGDTVYKGITVLELPGHTPGCIGLLIEDQKLVIAGDAVKNAWDYVRGDPGLCFAGVDMGEKSMEKVKSLAVSVIPGHDRQFAVNGQGDVKYLTSLEVEILSFVRYSAAEPQTIRIEG